MASTWQCRTCSYPKNTHLLCSLCFVPRSKEDPTSAALCLARLQAQHAALSAVFSPSPPEAAIAAKIASAAAMRARGLEGAAPAGGAPSGVDGILALLGLPGTAADRGRGGGGGRPPARAPSPAVGGGRQGAASSGGGGGGGGGGGAPARAPSPAPAPAPARAPSPAPAPAPAPYGGAPPWRRLYLRGLPPDAAEGEVAAHINAAITRALLGRATDTRFVEGVHAMGEGRAMVVLASEPLATAVKEQMGDALLLRGARLSLTRPADYKKQDDGSPLAPLRLNVVREEPAAEPPTAEALAAEQRAREAAREAAKKRAAAAAAAAAAAGGSSSSGSGGNGGGGGGGGGGAHPAARAAAAPAPKVLSAKEQKKAAERELAERKAAAAAALTPERRAFADRVRLALPKRELACLQSIAAIYDVGSAQDVDWDVVGTLLQTLSELGVPLTCKVKADQINCNKNAGGSVNLPKPRGHHVILMTQHMVGDLRKLLPDLDFPLAAFNV
jgi:hypothetical protein